MAFSLLSLLLLAPAISHAPHTHHDGHECIHDHVDKGVLTASHVAYDDHPHADALADEEATLAAAAAASPLSTASPHRPSSRRRRRLLSNDPSVRPLRIRFELVDATDFAGAEGKGMRDYIEGELLPWAKKYWANALGVIPVKGKLAFSPCRSWWQGVGRECQAIRAAGTSHPLSCGSVPVPEYMVGAVEYCPNDASDPADCKMSKTTPNGTTWGAENTDTKARHVTRHKNMISITGHECDGLKITASMVHTYALIFFLAIIMTHLFTKNTKYGSVNPFGYKNLHQASTQAPANVTEAAAEIIQEVVNATINGTA